MLIAGEASGDLLAAELVVALRAQMPDARISSAPADRKWLAGVDLEFDLTQHSAIGISDVLKNLFEYRRLFNRLLELAIRQKPDAVIGVDYGGFNLRFGHAIQQQVRKQLHGAPGTIQSFRKSSSSFRRRSGRRDPAGRTGWRQITTCS